MNRNKSLVFSSSLLLLALGAIACSSTPVNLGNGRDGVGTIEPNPDDDNTGGSDASSDPSCVYDDNAYADGQTFPSADGCNTCTCDDGAVACTERACDVMPDGGCNYAGAVYADGANFPSDDGCNTCSCAGGTVACTERACAPEAGGCELGGVHYKNGDRIPSTDCNSMWCQDGMFAGTLIECGVAGNCTYDGHEYAVGESFSYAGGLTVCTCEPEGLNCITEDMCTASVRLCEENGGDPMGCAAMYAGCMPSTPAYDACEESLTACRRDAMSASSKPVDCDAQYVSCQEAWSMPFMCDVAQVSCLEADPTDANGDCSEAYMRCAGGIDPSNPLAACGQELDSCRMDGGMQCVPEYIACVNESSVVQPDPEPCDMNGMFVCQDGGAAN